VELWAGLAVTILGAVIGVVLSAHYAQRAESQRTRIVTTLDLYQNFQSDQMLRCRIRGSRVLMENEAAEEPSSFCELNREIDAESRYQVSRLIHFFEMLGALGNLRYLDRNLVRELFQEYFEFYYAPILLPLAARSEQRDPPREREWVSPIKRAAIRYEG